MIARSSLVVFLGVGACDSGNPADEEDPLNPTALPRLEVSGISQVGTDGANPGAMLTQVGEAAILQDGSIEL